MYKNTQGIVLRTSNYRDYDKMVSILTREYGRVDALFRGCRKQGSSLLASSCEFVCADYSFYKKSDRFIAVQGNVLRSFYNVTKDGGNFALANCLCDICAKVAVQNQPAHRLYALLASCLYNLCEGSSKDLVFGFFVLKLMDNLGIRPVLDRCVKCGSDEVSGISFSSSGATCKDCGVALKNGAVASMAQVYKIPSKHMKNWENQTESEFFAEWLAYILGEYPKSMRIFLQMK